MQIKSIALATLLTTAAFASIAQTAAADTGVAGINPMTGRSLTEEDLARQLSKSKLQTQLGQELVKQAQNSADLSLATLRQQAEKNRLVAETSAMGAPPGAGNARPSTRPATVIRPIGNSSSAPPASTSGYLPSLGNNLSPVSPPVRQSAAASGVLRIGSEVLNVAASPQGSAVRVEWVDSQTSPAPRMNAPLQPITVTPATGMMGVPSIPGMLPPPIIQQ